MVGGFAMGALADWIIARRSLALTFAMLAISTLISLNFAASEATRVFAYATVLLGVGSMLGNASGGLLRDWTQSFALVYAVALGLCLLLLGLALSLPKTVIRSVSPR